MRTRMDRRSTHCGSTRCGRNPQKLMLRACKEGDAAKVKRLLAAGLDANQAITSETPLATACLAGHCEVMDVLIASGAKIDHTYARRDHTAFWHALVSHKYFDLAMQLYEQMCATDSSLPPFSPEAYAGNPQSPLWKIPPSFHNDLAKIFVWAMDTSSAEVAQQMVSALDDYVEKLAAGGKDRPIYQEAVKALQTCLDFVAMHNTMCTMEDSPSRQRLEELGFSFTFRPEFNQVFTLTLHPAIPKPAQQGNSSSAGGPDRMDVDTAPVENSSTVTTVTTTMTATSTTTGPVTGNTSGVSQFVGVTHGQHLLDFAVELAEPVKLDLMAAPEPLFAVAPGSLLFAVVNFLCAQCGELPPPVRADMFRKLIPALIDQVKASLSGATDSAESLTVAKMTVQRAVAAPVIQLYVLDGLADDVQALVGKGDKASKDIATNLACWAWQNKGTLFAGVSAQAFDQVFWEHCKPLLTGVDPTSFEVKGGLVGQSPALANGAKICGEVFQSTQLAPALALAQPLHDLWMALRGAA